MSLFLLTAIVMGLQLYTDTDLSYGSVDYVASFFPE